MDAQTKTDTAKIVSIPMGSPIPDWLLVAEPQVAGAPKGNWRFDCDVVVIELSTDFFVWPIVPLGEPSTCLVLDMTGMLGHNVDAATKPVRVIHQIAHFFPMEYRPAVAAAREALAARMAPPVARGEIVQELPRPGLFRRWWQGLFG